MVFGTRILVGSASGLYLYNKDSSTRWQMSLLGETMDPLAVNRRTSSPALVASTGGKQLGAIAVANHRVYLIEGNGKLDSKLETPGGSWGDFTPAADSKGNIYTRVVASGSRVAAICPSGKLLWMRSIVPGKGVSHVVIGEQDVIAVAAYSQWQPPPKKNLSKSVIVGLDPSCGKERWRRVVNDGTVAGIVVGRHGRIFIGTFDQTRPDKIHGLTSRGSTMWSSEIDGSTIGGQLGLASLGPLGADDKLYILVANAYVGTTAEKQPYSSVRAYSTQTGKLLWSLESKRMFPGRSQPILRADGVLVFGADVQDGTVKPSIHDAYLFAVQTTSPGLATGPWPRAYHDNSNTSRISP